MSSKLMTTKYASRALRRCSKRRSSRANIANRGVRRRVLGGAPGEIRTPDPQLCPRLLRLQEVLSSLRAGIGLESLNCNESQFQFSYLSLLCRICVYLFRLVQL